MRIMLVEDDMLLAQSLTDRLEGQGFHVDEADRGEDGWNYRIFMNIK